MRHKLDMAMSEYQKDGATLRNMLKQKARIASRSLARVPSLYWLFLYVAACLGFGLFFWAFLTEEFFHANITREPSFMLAMGDLRVDLRQTLFDSHIPAVISLGGKTAKIDRVDMRFDNNPDTWLDQGVMTTMFFDVIPEESPLQTRWIRLSLIPRLGERPFQDPPKGAFIQARSCYVIMNDSEPNLEMNCSEDMQLLRRLLGRKDKPTTRDDSVRPIEVDLPSPISHKLFMSMPRAASGIQYRDIDGSLSRMLYFSATTITTVGFGDIVPLTDRARIFVGLEALTGIVIIGLFLNAVAHELTTLHLANSLPTEVGTKPASEK